MTLGMGVVVAVLGRYGSDAGEPFVPRIETAGLTLTPRAHAAAVEALQAAWEATNPWADKVALERKATAWLTRSLAASGYEHVEIQVSVIDDIPFQAEM